MSSATPAASLGSHVLVPFGTKTGWWPWQNQAVDEGLAPNTDFGISEIFSNPMVENFGEREEVSIAGTHMGLA